MRHDHSVIYERLRHVANVAIFAADIQARRIESDEPEDSQILSRRWIDYHFLLIALSRLREAAGQLTKIELIGSKMEIAVSEFDRALPWLRDVRNVVAHFDEYPIGKGKNKKIAKESTEVASFGEDSLEWLGVKIKPRDALAEGGKLFRAIQELGPMCISDEKVSPSGGLA